MSIYPHVPYFYIIRHKPSGTLYAGAKWSFDANPNNFMIQGGYTTSSNKVNCIIESENLSSFETVIIITEFGFGMSAYEYETIFLQTWDIAKDANWLNDHNNEFLSLSYDCAEFKNIMLRKYGVEHNSYLESTKNKRRETSIKNTGYSHRLKSPKLLKEYQDNLLEKFGVINVFQMESTKEKSKETILEKFGVDNVSKSEEIKKLKIETCLRNNGVEYTFQSAEFREKSRLTCIESHGVDYPMQSPIIREKSANTLLEKYGVTNSSQIPAVRQKKE